MSKVTIEIITPIKLTNMPKAISIVSDTYIPNLIDFIKTTKIRAYNPINKSWEVALYNSLPLLETIEKMSSIDSVEYIPDKESIASEITSFTQEINSKSRMKLAVGNPIKNKKEELSLYVSFYPINETLKDFLKDNKSFFIPESKAWETKLDLADKILEIANEESFLIIKDKSFTEALQRLENQKRVIEESKNKDWDAVLNNYDFKTKPYSYQIEGIKRGLQDNNLLLTDEQGLGKTLQALYIADIKSKEEGYKYTLIVCGVNGLKYNWLAEVEEHLGEEAYILGSRINRNGNLTEGTIKERLEALNKIENGEINNRFIITNIETLRNQDIKEKIRELCIKDIIGMTIIDEMHRVSNIKSAQGSSLNFLKTRNKIGLTGTPVVNKPFDLYAPLTWLGIEKRSEYDFKHRYGVYVERYGQGRSYQELIEYTNLGELKDILSNVMLRREKKDVLDLPEVVYMKETIELDKEQQKLYNLIRNELVSQIDELVLDPNPLAKFTRLRQACSCPRALDGSITKNAKYKRAIELIEDIRAEGKKAIIYSNFAFAVRELDALLKDNKIKSYTITGEEKNKKAVIDKFKENGDVLVGSIQALGTGYTITEATTIIFLDLPWTYANLIQAVDRAHRIGQKNNITVISLLAKDSVDEKMYKIVKKKQDLFEDLMEGKDIKGVNRKKLTKSLLGVK